MSLFPYNLAHVCSSFFNLAGALVARRGLCTDRMLESVRQLLWYLLVAVKPQASQLTALRVLAFIAIYFIAHFPF